MELIPPRVCFFFKGELYEELNSVCFVIEAFSLGAVPSLLSFSGMGEMLPLSSLVFGMLYRDCFFCVLLFFPGEHFLDGVYGTVNDVTHDYY